MWYLKKRSFCQVLALYILIAPFFLNFLQDFLHLPSLIKYTVDLAWVVAVVRLVFDRIQFVYKKTLPILILILTYLLYVSIGYLFKYQSVFYFLWGLRNNLRFYVAFMVFVYFLDGDDIQWSLKLIDILFAVHVVVTFFQFFVLGYQWDYLGGIFGVRTGCNGHSLMLLLVVCIKSLLTYMHNEEGLILCLLKCGASFIIAAMAELKVFFVLFLLLLVVAALITKFSAKKILIIVSISFVVFLAGSIFTSIWGNDKTLTVERIVELITATSYSSERDISRFTALPVISNSILVETPQKLFGLGLGNCETSSFAICNTPFFQSHSYMNYDWLSSAFAFLETGYFGLGLALSFFVVVYICARRMKRRGEGMALYAEMAMVMAVACIVLFFYNSSLRTDIGYIAYFVLVLPFVSTTPDSVHKSAVLEN